MGGIIKCITGSKLWLTCRPEHAVGFFAKGAFPHSEGIAWTKLNRGDAAKQIERLQASWILMEEGDVLPSAFFGTRT